MQTVPIFNRERPKAELARITCCLEWMGVAGPLEFLVLDIGRNSNFCFVVKCFVDHA